MVGATLVRCSLACGVSEMFLGGCAMCSCCCWFHRYLLHRSCMVEESGTLESQLEATKVSLTSGKDCLVKRISFE